MFPKTLLLIRDVDAWLIQVVYKPWLHWGFIPFLTGSSVFSTRMCFFLWRKVCSSSCVVLSCMFFLSARLSSPEALWFSTLLDFLHKVSHFCSVTCSPPPLPPTVSHTIVIVLWLILVSVLVLFCIFRWLTQIFSQSSFYTHFSREMVRFIPLSS